MFLNAQVVSLFVMMVIANSWTVEAVEPKELVGKFVSKVTEPNGDEYEGTCEIKHSAGRTVELIWKYGKKTSVGTGKLDKDGTLTVEYKGAVADREGNATYDVKSSDRLVGKFHRKGTKGFGKEILTREK